VAMVISNAIQPYWDTIMKYNKSFSFLYNLFLFVTSFGVIKPIFKFTSFICRLTLGSILSATGILWSETLMSIDSLKSFAVMVKELLEYYTDIIIPVNSSTVKISDNNIILSTLPLIPYLIPSPSLPLSLPLSLPHPFPSPFPIRDKGRD
jgi:hypothetical protein